MKPTPEQAELARKVADTIEGLNPRDEYRLQDEDRYKSFCMARVYYECAAPACIAGWTCYLAEYESGKDTMSQAAEHLGLDAFQQNLMFAPVSHQPHGLRYAAKLDEEGYISPQLAAACLRHYAKTGSVSWTKAKKAVQT